MARTVSRWRAKHLLLLRLLLEVVQPLRATAASTMCTPIAQGWVCDSFGCRRPKNRNKQKNLASALQAASSLAGGGNCSAATAGLTAFLSVPASLHGKREKEQLLARAAQQ